MAKRETLDWWKQNAWTIGVLLIVNVLAAAVAETKDATRVLIFLSGFGFWFFAAFCWRSRRLRIFAILAVLAWCANTLTSILFQIEYDGAVNTFTAQCILLTNTKEALGMMHAHSEWLLSAVVIFGAMFWWLSKLSKPSVIPPKILKGVILVTGLYLISLPVIYTVNGKYKRQDFSYSEKVLLRTPLYNAVPFITAAEAIKKERRLRGQVVNYDLQTHETGTDVYVVVIGESARRSHLSLYGYSRATSPCADAQRRNMLLFEQAIAPAPMTFMAVALSLCKPGENPGMPPNLADNIVNVAKKAGFKTYWLDREPLTAGNLLDQISDFADKNVFEISPYDENIIPVLSEVLSEESKKKLIIIHINGSHSPYEPWQHPPEAVKFKDGASEDLNNYDNSIYATDAFLGKLFSLLNRQRASLLYYSDHAVALKTTFGHSRFRHGSVNFPREAVDIPMFIWFSEKASNQNKGKTVKAPYSAGDNYRLINNWLGVNFKNETDAQQTSPLKENYVPRAEVIVLDTAQEAKKYSDLPSEKK